MEQIHVCMASDGGNKLSEGTLPAEPVFDATIPEAPEWCVCLRFFWKYGISYTPVLQVIVAKAPKKLLIFLKVLQVISSPKIHR
jgi:hypothetical protein